MAAPGPWIFTDAARKQLLDGTFNVDADSFKMALFKSTSNLGAASTLFSGVTNECDTGGYVAGGIAVDLTVTGTTVATVDIAVDPIWTVSSTSLVARFACIYEIGGNVLCYCLLDSTPADITVSVGNTLTIAANVAGVFTLT